MSLITQVTTTPDSQSDDGYTPVRINIQGIDGIGKSTFGADADTPIFIQAEDGLNYIDQAARFPVANTWEEIKEQIKALMTEDHQFKTVVLDTTDAASKLAEEFVVKENGWKSPSDPKASYGAFYVAEENAWRHLLQGLNWLHDNKGMNVILLSHVGDKIVNDPTVGEYRAFQMRSNKKVNALIKDWVDFNLFADYDKTLNADGTAKSSGNRFLYTRYGMGFEAKSRLDIPVQLPLSWDEFIKAYRVAYKKALSSASSTKTEAA